jgi:hypothetical protein
MQMKYFVLAIMLGLVFQVSGMAEEIAWTLFVANGTHVPTKTTKKELKALDKYNEKKERVE